MSILIFVVGFIIAWVGAKLWQAGQAQGGQGTGSSLLTFTLLVTGFGFMIWGAVRIFF